MLRKRTRHIIRENLVPQLVSLHFVFPLEFVIRLLKRKRYGGNSWEHVSFVKAASERDEERKKRAHENGTEKKSNRKLLF